jgi:hypothetical protein
MVQAALVMHVSRSLQGPVLAGNPVRIARVHRRMALQRADF